MGSCYPSFAPLPAGTLQNILRPFDLELGHISENARRLEAHRDAEATLRAELHSITAELRSGTATARAVGATEPSQGNCAEIY